MEPSVHGFSHQSLSIQSRELNGIDKTPSSEKTSFTETASTPLSVHVSSAKGTPINAQEKKQKIAQLANEYTAHLGAKTTEGADSKSMWHGLGVAMLAITGVVASSTLIGAIPFLLLTGFMAYKYSTTEKNINAAFEKQQLGLANQVKDQLKELGVTGGSFDRLIENSKELARLKNNSGEIHDLIDEREIILKKLQIEKRKLDPDDLKHDELDSLIKEAKESITAWNKTKLQNEKAVQEFEKKQNELINKIISGPVLRQVAGAIES